MIAYTDILYLVALVLETYINMLYICRIENRLQDLTINVYMSTVPPWGHGGLPKELLPKRGLAYNKRDCSAEDEKKYETKPSAEFDKPRNTNT